MELISIVIPIYKTASYISKCATSLFEQTYKNIEYVFIDDCSPDDSVEVLAKVINNYPNRQGQIKIIRHEINRGSAAVRNKGLDNASGSYIIFIDSDDYCELDMIECMYKSIKENKADVVIADFYVNYHNKQFVKLQKAPNTGNKCISALLQGVLHGSTCNKLISKKIVDKYNIRFIEGLNVWEDLLFMVKYLFYTSKVFYLNKPFLHYVQHNTSQTSRLSKMSLNKIKEIVYEIESFLEQKNAVNLFIDDIGQLKNAVRFVWLQSVTYKQLKEINIIFPSQKNIKIWDNKVYPIYHKFSLFLVLHRQYVLAYLVLLTIKRLKICFRK